MAKPALGISLCGLKLSNPAILASGVLGETAGSMIRCAENGAGAIVTKSISAGPRTGYPNPTIVECEHGLLNAMGLPNPGIDEYKYEMERAVKESGVPVIGSIFGSTADEFARLAVKMEKYRASAVELNLSCPHVKGGGAEIGCEPAAVKEITAHVKARVKIPVFVKLTPNIADIVTIARAAREGGADAVVAINTVRGMAIDLECAKPVLHNKMGGYSGNAIKPIGVRAVYAIHRELDIPIIGCGGVGTGRDALEYIMAGATAVQVGSGVYYRGPAVFRKITDEIAEFIRIHKYGGIKELIGAANEKNR